MKYRKHNLLIIVLFCVIFTLITVISHSALTKDYKTVYLPIPVGIDLEHYIESSMLIKVDMKSYNNISFGEFMSKHKRQDELRLKEYLLALKQKDINKLKSISINRPEIDWDAIFAGLSDQYSDEAIGPNFENLHMIERFNIGNFILFIWRKTLNPNTNENTYLGSFFEKNDSGAILCTTNETTYPIGSFLFNIVSQQAESRGTYLTKESAKHNYESPLIEDAKNHQSYLCFDGMVCDVNVYSDNTNPSNEIARFYKEAYITLKNQNMTEFAQFYTEKSRDRIIEWQRTDPNMANLFRNEAIRKERKIIFIIDGDPVYIVFYYNPNLRISVKYEYIFRENGTLKLTNFGYHDAFDQLLMKPDFFIEPFLAPMIKDITEKANSR